MRHEQVQDNLSAYIEGTLDPATRAAVDNHIRECADCYREVATVRSVIGLLDSPVARVEPPPMFHDNVMRRIRVQQREALRVPKRGLFARLGWGWTAAGAVAAAAAFVALVFSVGPLQEGAPASFVFTPRWMHAAPTVTVSQAPDLVIGSDGTPAAAGQEYHLNLDFLARSSGTWKMTVRTSPGIALLFAGTDPDGTGTYTVWEGQMDRGAKSGLTLMLQPFASNTVQELTVRFANMDTGYSVERMVFVPVQTGGNPGRTLDWQTGPTTLQRVLEDAAREYGTPITAPADILTRPVTLQARNANAGNALQAVAASEGLHYNLYNDSYNLFP